MTVRILNNHAVIRTDTPAQLQALFPESRLAILKGQTFVAVPHTIESSRILNNIGLKTPSPIRTQYNWPGRYKPRWYQVDTADFFVQNMRCHCHNAQRCVDASTEYLTPYGWKRIDTYEDGEVVAQWNPETDQAEFVQPMEYIDTPCEFMVHFKTSQGIDQMLTSNHRVPYLSSNGTLRETTAIHVHEQNQKCNFGWRGKLPVTFKAPGRVGIPLSDSEIRVMVMTIADGWFQSSTSRCHVRVKKERKKARARMLLGDAGLLYQEYEKDYPTAVRYSVFRFTAPRREKEFSSFWWDATEEQLRVIVEEASHWDSSPRRSDAFAFSTYKKKSAEFIQYAAVATKRVASLNSQVRTRRGKTETEYVVYIRGNGRPLSVASRSASMNPSSSIVLTPNGRCYCFSVPSTYIIFRRNGCVFISGNTGKTLSALWAADFLRQQGLVHRVLIDAPLSTLWDVWEQNIFESFPFRTFCVLHGSRKKRLELLAKKHDFYIVNHHGMKIIEEALKDRPDIDLVIIDEAATLRNSRSPALWKPTNNVINRQGIVRSAWGLTGTPTPNDPTDAFGQCKLITPENYHGHFTSFKNETMMQFGMWKWVPKRGHEAAVARILKPSIRFERSVCTDMEPCYIERRAQLSEEQKLAYKQLIQKATTEVNGSTVTAVNAAVLISKLVQCAAGVVIAADGSLAKMDFGPRLSVLEELIEENEEKVIVFVPFTGALDAIAIELRKRWTVAVVDGGVSAGKRTEIFRAFRSSKDPHILLCHPKVMAHGLDLTAASLSIWYAAYWHAEVYQQANARMDGSRQKVKIDIAHIYATVEEKKIYSVLREKGRLQDVILGLSNRNDL